MIPSFPLNRPAATLVLEYWSTGNKSQITLPRVRGGIYLCLLAKLSFFHIYSLARKYLLIKIYLSPKSLAWGASFVICGHTQALSSRTTLSHLNFPTKVGSRQQLCLLVSTLILSTSAFYGLFSATSCTILCLLLLMSPLRLTTLELLKCRLVFLKARSLGYFLSEKIIFNSVLSYRAVGCVFQC